MKKILIALAISFAIGEGYAQNINYTINSTFQPLSMEELMMSARAEAYRQQIAQQRFEEYKDKAYTYLNKGDYQGFLYYSDYALSTGWYNNKMYYDRGVAFEKFHEYRKAKKE